MTLITQQKRDLFAGYATEFEKSYLLEPAGQKHLAQYRSEGQELKQTWTLAKKKDKTGEKITDIVLEKLLPHSNTRHNREHGYHISIAPAITKDLRKWFENAGWQKASNWDKVARAIYDLFYALVEKNDWTSLEKFEGNANLSRGIKAGVITPTLHFLKSECRIVNNKTIDTVNFLLCRDAIGRDLSQYKANLETINKAIEELQIPLLVDPDVFDAFCHWMCDKRLGGYARVEKPVEQPEDEGVPVFEDAIEPQSHWEAIYYIVKAGNLLGYKTYVADPSRSAFKTKLGSIATLSEAPPILKSAPEIARVDVIWYRPTPPFFLFEVEDGGTMREALHRLYNAMAFDARFFVVCPIQNQPKFEKWVSTEPFREFKDRYNFRTYSDLFNFYNELSRFVATRQRFLRV
ncbi:MAG: hypothetical protein L6437_01815 [Kiritimatiellae bacterium]|nr:hypothetical protein [Kiritimatiellia bacterium]